MWLKLNAIGKLYNNHVIFKNINYQFNEHKIHAIIGSNGSGKSTLLKIISGYLSPSKGNIESSISGYTRQIAYCAPYISLIPELTLEETFNLYSTLNEFKCGFREFKNNLALPEDSLKTKKIESYSSGMQQKVKLGLAIMSTKPLLLLDEPCNNLDSDAINWYQTNIVKNIENRILIIASNNKTEEIHIAEDVLEINNYKK